MSSLMITDIRKSVCDRGSDIVTAIFLNGDANNADKIRFLDGRSLLVLESATAHKEIQTIGVHSGDQYIRIRANPGHGLMVGEKIRGDGRWEL